MVIVSATQDGPGRCGEFLLPCPGASAGLAASSKKLPVAYRAVKRPSLVACARAEPASKGIRKRKIGNESSVAS